MAAFLTDSNDARSAHDLLLPLSAALNNIVSDGGAAWHKQVGPEGVLHVARSTMIASSWLAAALREEESHAAAASATEFSSLFPDEDKTFISESLGTVWR